LNIGNVNDVLKAMHAADRSMMDSVGHALPDIERATHLIVTALDRGGRCIYLGAGTSGRLGVLDAAELGPTFGVDRQQVIAVIAGGPDAVTHAIEGAEDDTRAAARDLDAAALCERDVVVGISASGRTPYVVAGLEHAREAQAATIALVCAADAPACRLADVAIVVLTGPEVLRGSTRLKAGTAQKLVLNMLSTAVMAARGRIVDGEMVSMRPTNDKLRRRAISICSRLLGLKDEAARELLERCGWDLPTSLVAGRHELTAEAAQARLAAVHGNVEQALESP